MTGDARDLSSGRAGTAGGSRVSPVDSDGAEVLDWSGGAIITRELPLVEIASIFELVTSWSFIEMREKCLHFLPTDETFFRTFLKQFL